MEKTYKPAGKKYNHRNPVLKNLIDNNPECQSAFSALSASNIKQHKANIKTIKTKNTEKKDLEKNTEGHEGKENKKGCKKKVWWKMKHFTVRRLQTVQSAEPNSPYEQALETTFDRLRAGPMYQPCKYGDSDSSESSQDLDDTSSVLGCLLEQKPTRRPRRKKPHIASPKVSTIPPHSPDLRRAARRKPCRGPQLTTSTPLPHTPQSRRAIPVPLTPWNSPPKMQQVPVIQDSTRESEFFAEPKPVASNNFSASKKLVTEVTSIPDDSDHKITSMLISPAHELFSSGNLKVKGYDPELAEKEDFSLVMLSAVEYIRTEEECQSEQISNRLFKNVAAGEVESINDKNESGPIGSFGKISPLTNNSLSQNSVWMFDSEELGCDHRLKGFGSQLIPVHTTENSAELRASGSRLQLECEVLDKVQIDAYKITSSSEREHVLHNVSSDVNEYSVQKVTRRKRFSDHASWKKPQYDVSRDLFADTSVSVHTAEESDGSDACLYVDAQSKPIACSAPQNVAQLNCHDVSVESTAGLASSSYVEVGNDEYRADDNFPRNEACERKDDAFCSSGECKGKPVTGCSPHRQPSVSVRNNSYLVSEQREREHTSENVYNTIECDGTYIDDRNESDCQLYVGNNQPSQCPSNLKVERIPSDESWSFGHAACNPNSCSEQQVDVGDSYVSDEAVVAPNQVNEHCDSSKLAQTPNHLPQTPTQLQKEVVYRRRLNMSKREQIAAKFTKTTSLPDLTNCIGEKIVLRRQTSLGTGALDADSSAEVSQFLESTSSNVSDPETSVEKMCSFQANDTCSDNSDIAKELPEIGNKECKETASLISKASSSFCNDTKVHRFISLSSLSAEKSSHLENNKSVVSMEDHTGNCAGAERWLQKQLGNTRNSSPGGYGHRRYTRHQIVVGKHASSAWSNLRNDLSPSSGSLNHLDWAVGLDEEKVLEVFELDVDEDPIESFLSPRDLVMQRCQQQDPLPFASAFGAGYLENCLKIGEGVYGEVFLHRDGLENQVIKIIPIEGQDLINGERQKKYEEILSEIIISMELSNLRTGNHNCTSNFPEVLRCLCVKGEYPPSLLTAWFAFQAEQGSENECPEIFGEEQLFIVLELANGGKDLETYSCPSSLQAMSILVQTAFALAVAEAAFSFEHRDLHWGNVLVAPTKELHITFVLDDREYKVPTGGVKVTIIDFTLSRMSYDRCCIFNDLSKDPELFVGMGDRQFDVYRNMKNAVENDWTQFVPYTNILWLDYLADKLHHHKCQCKSRAPRGHTQAKRQLKQFLDKMLHFDSARDLVVQSDLRHCLPCTL